jgi:hypothetical protein
MGLTVINELKPLLSSLLMIRPALAPGVFADPVIKVFDHKPEKRTYPEYEENF